MSLWGKPAADAVAEYWSRNVAGSDPFSPQVYWLAVPEVQRRYQRLACAGLPYPSWVEYVVGEFLRPVAPSGARIASFGCGSGALERHLYALRAFSSCEAYDIAPGAIEAAQREAAAAGLTGVRYAVRDLQREPVTAGELDAAFFNGSLHHIEALETVLDGVRAALKPGGWLFINEYVGANAFGFGPRQRACMEAAFRLIPPRCRRSFLPGDRGKVLEAAPIPDPVAVARTDPSEAVRSQDIMPVLRKRFDVVAENPCGGTLLQFLLAGIAGNFVAADPSSLKVLDMLFAVEDALIAAGDLPSDFVVVAARRR